ncbi:hypothetical protein DB32_002229 [Sandaracinus amylolyticus]|uniref:Uncharacterized protein n=1 Tax=Sandaracinus amylolyticus TaxID=927083 RepID=A0A0F6W1J7_9BACT|nr:hypothetical protein DB32_002229 [Sandaracinus amylolyticus]
MSDRARVHEHAHGSRGRTRFATGLAIATTEHDLRGSRSPRPRSNPITSGPLDETPTKQR